MGQASTRAAVIYQHASAQRDKAIAASLNKAIEVEQRLLRTATVHDPPTAMARKWHADQKSAVTEDDDEINMSLTCGFRRWRGGGGGGDEGTRTPNPCLANARFSVALGP
jgi:hypothetical protein